MVLLVILICTYVKALSFTDWLREGLVDYGFSSHLIERCYRTWSLIPILNYRDLAHSPTTFLRLSLPLAIEVAAFDFTPVHVECVGVLMPFASSSEMEVADARALKDIRSRRFITELAQKYTLNNPAHPVTYLAFMNFPEAEMMQFFDGIAGAQVSEYSRDLMLQSAFESALRRGFHEHLNHMFEWARDKKMVNTQFYTMLWTSVPNAVQNFNRYVVVAMFSGEMEPMRVEKNFAAVQVSLAPRTSTRQMIMSIIALQLLELLKLEGVTEQYKQAITDITARHYDAFDVVTNMILLSALQSNTYAFGVFKKRIFEQTGLEYSGILDGESTASSASPNLGQAVFNEGENEPLPYDDFSTDWLPLPELDPELEAFLARIPDNRQ